MIILASKMLGMKLPVRETIETLGIPEVMRLLGMSRTAVRSWLEKNEVPHWQSDRFQQLAKHLPRKPKTKQS